MIDSCLIVALVGIIVYLSFSHSQDNNNELLIVISIAIVLVMLGLQIDQSEERQNKNSSIQKFNKHNLIILKFNQPSLSHNKKVMESNNVFKNIPEEKGSFCTGTHGFPSSSQYSSSGGFRCLSKHHHNKIKCK